MRDMVYVWEWRSQNDQKHLWEFWLNFSLCVMVKYLKPTLGGEVNPYSQTDHEIYVFDNLPYFNAGKVCNIKLSLVIGFISSFSPQWCCSNPFKRNIVETKLGWKMWPENGQLGIFSAFPNL